MSDEWPDPHTLDLTRIFHATDFSFMPEIAFAHALKLALVSRSKLTIFHVNKTLNEMNWYEFPSVRETLVRWGLLPVGSTRNQIKGLGLTVEKILARGKDPSSSILRHLERHPADLIVLPTHQLGGQPFFPSIAEPVARESKVMTLFLPQHTKGIVSWEDGTVQLHKVLIPVNRVPHPQLTIQAITGLACTLGCQKVSFTLLHVGQEQDMPSIHTPRQTGWTWHTSIRTGDIVQQILQAEQEDDSDLIVMTTQGHQGFLDALRGSTTERVVRGARCPILTLSAQ